MRRRILKRIGYFFAFIIVLLGILALALQTSQVQNYITDKILTNLSEKYKAEWSIQEIEIDFMDEVLITGALFKDQHGDTLLSAEKVMVDIGLLNLISQEIRLDQVELTGVTSHIYNKDGAMNFDFLLPEKKQPSDAQKNAKAWDFSIGEVNLNTAKVMVNLPEQSINTQLNAITLDFSTTDFNNNIIKLSSVSMDNLNLDFTETKISKSEGEFTIPNLGWEISVDAMKAKNSNINYSSLNDTIQISNSNLAIDDIDVNDENISAEISDASFTFNDKIQIEEIKSLVQLENDDLTIENFSIQTIDDIIQLDLLNYNLNRSSGTGENLGLNVDYETLRKLDKYLPSKINLAKNVEASIKVNSFSFIDKKISTNGLNISYGDIITLNGNVNLLLQNANNPVFDATIGRLKIDLHRTAKLWDDFELPDSLSQYDELTVSGAIEGNANNLTFQDVDLNLDDVLQMNASGSIIGIAKPKDLEFDLDINYLNADIAQLPIPQNPEVAIDSLGIVNFSGRLKGNVEDLDLIGKLDSGLGSLNANINLKNADDIPNFSYKGTLELKDFDLGTLLKNESLNTLNFRMNLDGRGLDLENLNSKFEGVLSEFEYNGYTYEDIEINAQISERKIKGEINIVDDNATLSYDGVIQLDTQSTIFNFTAAIDTLNLEALGFMKEPVTIKGNIDSEIRLPLRKGEAGKIDITQLVLANGLEVFKEDSMALRANKTVDSTYVTLDADFANISMEGQFGIRDVPLSIGDLIDYYINLDTNFVHFEERSKNLKLVGQIKTLKPVNIFMPELFVQSGPINLDTKLNFENNDVSGSVSMDSFFVSTFFSEKLTLKLSSESNNILANLKGENNELNSSAIPILSIQNTLSKKKLSTIFEARDDDKFPRLKFGLNTEFLDDYTSISMSTGLILNKKEWSASDDNFVRIYPDKLIVENLKLTDNNEFLTINSTDRKGSGLEIDFKNFNIGQFTTLITSKPSKLTGNIDGSIELLDMNRDLYYLVNLKVEDMIYDSTRVGMLTIDADDNQSTGILTTDISLIGPSNNVQGGGTYNPKSTAMDFRLDVNSFQMMLLDPFLSNIIRESEGNVEGAVSVKGTADQPLIDGEITLENAITTIVVNNTRYGIDRQTISFDNNSIDIGLVDIFDAKDNVATVSGKIYHSFLSDMELDMNVSTDKFTFLNTSASDNPVFYGRMVLEADVDVSGPIDLLDVQVVARTLDSTEINLSPFSIEKFLLEEDFITYGKPSDFEGQTNEYLLKLARKFPFKVNIILDATSDAQMNFVVDPVTGDKIVGKGRGNLRIKLNPDGQQEIFGTYTISEGAYTFSYGEFVSKDFSVKPGSTVKFNGDPLNAVLDIDAIYEVYTTTYELIKNEIATNSSEVSAAQRRTNVEVYLSLKGTLDSPIIKLDIRLPDLESANLITSIDRKLDKLRANPNELNNQVFGLLIFNSFILSDNVVSGFENIGNNIALSSVSGLITNQLNKLADKVVKGVDVDINVNSYDSNYANEGAGGTITEVGLKVSKQLFNDRLSISAGGNFDLSGQSDNQSYSSLIGDFVLEYKLTESGRYRLRVFSKSDYDRFINQNTNKNGVSIFFNRAFDSKIDD